MPKATLTSYKDHPLPKHDDYYRIGASSFKIKGSGDCINYYGFSPRGLEILAQHYKVKYGIDITIIDEKEFLYGDEAQVSDFDQDRIDPLRNTTNPLKSAKFLVTTQKFHEPKLLQTL